MLLLPRLNQNEIQLLFDAKYSECIIMVSTDSICNSIRHIEFKLNKDLTPDISDGNGLLCCSEPHLEIRHPEPNGAEYPWSNWGAIGINPKFFKLLSSQDLSIVSMGVILIIEESKDFLKYSIKNKK